MTSHETEIKCIVVEGVGSFLLGSFDSFLIYGVKIYNFNFITFVTGIVELGLRVHIIRCNCSRQTGLPVPLLGLSL